MDRKLLIALLLVILLGTFLRLLTLHFGVFMDPDDYFYYSVAQQTMAHGLTLTSQLSGFPVHNAYNEGAGLIYLPILFTYLTNNLFLSIAILPVIFAVLEMLAVYVLTAKISRNRYSPLLATFLFAITQGALVKNIFGEYRGDSMVPFLMALTLIIIIYARERKSRAIALIAILPVALSLWIWKGGIYVLAVIALFAALLFLEQKLRKLWKVVVIAVAIAIIGMILFMLLQNSGIFGVTSAVSIIAELQPTTVNYLVLALGLSIGIAPIGVLIYVLKDSTSRRRRKDNFIFLALFSLLLVTFALQLTGIRWSSLLAMPLMTFTAYALAELYGSARGSKKFTVLFLCMVLAVSVALSAAQVPFNGPGNGMNPGFQAALAWIRNNTAANATFLTAWPDGSYVEGLGMRASYSDSMSGQVNGWRQFPQFLFARAGNFTYLYNVSPDYLLVRNYWADEHEGLAAEGGIYYNTSLNGTNLQLLTTQDNIPGLTLLFKNDDAKVYKVG